MRAVFSALGVVALFLAVMVGGYAAFILKPAIAPEEPIGLEATAEVTNQQAGQAAVAIGETVTAGDVSWTVTDASLETELCSFTFPPECVPGRYVSLEFTAENVADRPVTLTGETITLFDASGIEYQPEPDRNSVFVRPELNILFNEYSLLQPGVRKEGKVNFEVLSNASGITALLGDTDPTVSEGEYVDLEL
jgi:hypothetical protein